MSGVSRFAVGEDELGSSRLNGSWPSQTSQQREMTVCSW